MYRVTYSRERIAIEASVENGITAIRKGWIKSIVRARDWLRTSIRWIVR